MKKVKVTIAIPIYNVEAYLSYAIQSVINQTYPYWELLLMEDGSTDHSPEIARQYAKMDNRIIYKEDHANKGLIYRLNESVQMANCEYYARMDADDVMAVNRIEEELNYLLEHPDVNVVGSSIMTIDGKGKVIRSGLYKGNVLSFVHPTVMGKTEWFKANPYKEWALRAEDTELWLRTSARNKFRAIEKPLLFYREVGVPTYRKYLTSQMTMLKIFRKHKRYNKSMIWCVSNVVMTYAKMALCIVLALIGRMDILIRLRKWKPVPVNLLLSEEDYLKAIAEKPIDMQ